MNKIKQVVRGTANLASAYCRVLPPGVCPEPLRICSMTTAVTRFLVMLLTDKHNVATHIKLQTHTIKNNTSPAVRYLLDYFGERCDYCTNTAFTDENVEMM